MYAKHNAIQDFTTHQVSALHVIINVYNALALRYLIAVNVKRINS